MALAVPSSALCQDANTATVNPAQASLAIGQGRSAAARLESTWGPKVAAIAKRRAELDVARARLEREKKRSPGFWPWTREKNRRGRAAEARRIDVANRALIRNNDDYAADFEQDRLRALNELGPRMQAVIETYAREHGNLHIVQTSESNGPPGPAQNDITPEIVRAYDRTYPADPN